MPLVLFFLSVRLNTIELPPFLCSQERALPIGMEVLHFSAHCSGGGSAEDPGSLLWGWQRAAGQPQGSARVSDHQRKLFESSGLPVNESVQHKQPDW